MKIQTGMVKAKVEVVDWTTKENGKKKVKITYEECVHTKYARIRIPNDMQNVSEYITHSIYCISKQIYLFISIESCVNVQWYMWF